MLVHSTEHNRTILDPEWTQVCINMLICAFQIQFHNHILIYTFVWIHYRITGTHLRALFTCGMISFHQSLIESLILIQE